MLARSSCGPLRRADLRSRPVDDEALGAVTALLNSDHLDDVFVDESDDELAVVDPVLPAGEPGGLVEVCTPATSASWKLVSSLVWGAGVSTTILRSASPSLRTSQSIAIGPTEG
jgi:hypothetical protein